MNAPGVPCECRHAEVRHRHGTRGAYLVDRCRCDECRAANADAARRRRRDIAYGQWQPLTDAGPVVDHLRRLSQRGIGLRRVAELSGLPYRSLTRLIYATATGSPSPPRRVHTGTAQRILAVPLNSTSPAGGARIDGVGTQRRLQALVAVGWNVSALADMLGRDTASLRRTLHRERVNASTAAAVADMYERLWDTPPPETTRTERHASAEARAFARRQGWHPPMAWDDIDADRPPPPRPTLDAATCPDDVDSLDLDIVLDRITTGQHVALEPGNLRDAVIHRLTRSGYSLAQIADLLAITPRTVSRRRRVARVVT